MPDEKVVREFPHIQQPRYDLQPTEKATIQGMMHAVIAAKAEIFDLHEEKERFDAQINLRMKTAQERFELADKALKGALTFLGYSHGIANGALTPDLQSIIPQPRSE